MSSTSPVSSASPKDSSSNHSGDISVSEPAYDPFDSDATESWDADFADFAYADEYDNKLAYKLADFDYTDEYDNKPAYELSEHLFIPGMQNIISIQSDLGRSRNSKGNLLKTRSAGYTKFELKTLDTDFLPDGTPKSQATDLDHLLYSSE